MTHPEAAARAASRAPRWRPDTPLRALLLGAGIVLLLEGIHLLVILVFVFDPFRDLILGAASKATSSKRGFAIFLGALFVVPAALLLV